MLFLDVLSDFEVTIELMLPEIFFPSVSNLELFCPHIFVPGSENDCLFDELLDLLDFFWHSPLGAHDFVLDLFQMFSFGIVGVAVDWLDN